MRGRSAGGASAQISRRRRRGALALAAAALLAAPAALLAAPAATGAAPPPADGSSWRARVLEDPVPPLRHEGRWLVDATGRVVLLHGVNFVQKSAPFFPAARGFGADDVAFLAAHGWNAFRLGVVFEAIMPQPGQIDFAYIEHLAETVHELAARRIFVLLDFHQDGWGPVVHGNGMPAWATYTDGLPNPPEPFPTYYLTNPALQRAFENFWADRAAPDGVGLQQHYAAAARALAERLRGEPYVLGYEAMNEPWPGADWMPCLTGCPDQESRLLVPFYRRFADAVRDADRDAFVFVEPFVLFNFGLGDSSLPPIGAPGAGFSFHVYPLGAGDDLPTIDHGVAQAERSGDALLATEWGATSDPAAIALSAGHFDSRLVPWLFWAYEEVIRDTTLPPTPDNLRLDAVAALTRPYPVATDGTPTRLSFDPATRILEYEYATRQPGGRRSRFLETVIVAPRATYPTGYRVTAEGAVVTSRRGAVRLDLHSLPKATSVHVVVAPAP
ncbi:MAG TPA: cellulase family glycosylhydrolase [Myxococcota bacterium]|nr:cellulase family glycosylhydrolase [Myxococcota bacterium]